MPKRRINGYPVQATPLKHTTSLLYVLLQYMLYYITCNIARVKLYNPLCMNDARIQTWLVKSQRWWFNVKKLSSLMTTCNSCVIALAYYFVFCLFWINLEFFFSCSIVRINGCTHVLFKTIYYTFICSTLNQTFVIVDSVQTLSSL